MKTYMLTRFVFSLSQMHQIETTFSVIYDDGRHNFKTDMQKHTNSFPFFLVILTKMAKLCLATL